MQTSIIILSTLIVVIIMLLAYLRYYQTKVIPKYHEKRNKDMLDQLKFLKGYNDMARLIMKGSDAKKLLDNSEGDVDLWDQGANRACKDALESGYKKAK